MATKIIASTVNPLIDVDNPQQTLSNAKGVMWYLAFTAPTLAESGSNADANHGLSMLLECAAHAIGHAEQAMKVAGVNHG